MNIKYAVLVGHLGGWRWMIGAGSCLVFVLLACWLDIRIIIFTVLL